MKNKQKVRHILACDITVLVDRYLQHTVVLFEGEVVRGDVDGLGVLGPPLLLVGLDLPAEVVRVGVGLHEAADAGRVLPRRPVSQTLVRAALRQNWNKEKSVNKITFAFLLCNAILDFKKHFFHF